MPGSGLQADSFIRELPFLFWIAEGGDLRISAQSDALCRACGYTGAAFSGLQLSALLGPGELQSVESWVEAEGNPQEPLHLTGFLRRQDNTDFPVELVIGRTGEADHRKLAFFARERTRDNDPGQNHAAGAHGKLDALGIVTEGLGHEINNPLQIIFSNAEIALVYNKNPELIPYLNEIIAAAERIKSSLTSLRNFVKPDGK